MIAPMPKLKFAAAMVISKSACIGMKLLHRQASYLPGKIALKLCHDFLSQIGRPETVVAVTGTNGKTTVSNLLNGVLTSAGYEVSNNSAGSNIDAGVASCLIENSTFSGKAKKKLAVLECDERSSLRIYPHLKPDFIVCTNIMRDSVKRNANTDFISYIISSALPETTRMIVNADDILCSALGHEANPRVSFGVSHRFGTESDSIQGIVKDVTYCPVCGQELKAEYIRYNHIGRVYCPECSFRSLTPDYEVTKVEKNAITVSHGGTETVYPLPNDNITNIYNTVAAIALLTELGLTDEQIRTGLGGSKIVSSRFHRETCCGKTITLQLAKSQNPIACSRAFDYLRRSEGEKKTAIVIIDDIHDNVGNTENICWIHDCDYSPFADPSVKQVVFGGPRCHDHMLRALLDGVDPAKITLTDDYFHAIDQVTYEDTDSIFILYDLYLADKAKVIRDHLREKLEGMDK